MMITVVNTLIILALGSWAVVEFINGNFEKSQTLMLYVIFVSIAEGISAIYKILTKEAAE